MGWKAHATWHGLSSPWVWDGPYAPPVVSPPSSVRCHPTSAPFALLRGQSSVLRPPPTVLSVPSWKNPSVCSVCSVGQPSALRPRQLLRPPFSPFPPVKNPSVCSVCSVGQPSVVRRPSSVVCRPSLTPPRRVNPRHEGLPPFSVAKPNLHLPALDVYFYNSATPTITGKERGPWSLTVDFGDTCLFHDENSLSSRYSTVVWTTAKIRTRRRVHRDNESPKGRGNALSAAGLKTRQTPLGRS